jgi:hypothetical protein
MGIENHSRTGTKAFDFGHIVHTKPAPLIQSTGVGKHVATPGPVDVEFDAPAADGTLRMKRVKSAPAD